MHAELEHGDTQAVATVEAVSAQGSETQYAASSSASVGDSEIPSQRRPSFLARALARFGGGDRSAIAEQSEGNQSTASGEQTEDLASVKRPSFVERAARRLRPA